MGPDFARPLDRNTLDFKPFKQEKELVHQLNGEIWFVRHAESEANVQRIYANTGNSFPLTERGLEQVKALASQLSALNISAVYASPLLRAVQTAEEICRLNKIEVKIAPELTEYHMGIYEGTSSVPGTAGAFSDTASKKRWFEENNFDARSPGGESLRDMRDRFVPYLLLPARWRITWRGWDCFNDHSRRNIDNHAAVHL